MSYAAQAKTAQRLIRKKGGNVTFKRPAAGTLNITTDRETPGSERTMTIKAVMSSVTGKTASSFGSGSSSGVIKRQRQLLIAGLDSVFELLPEDKAFFDGKWWTVIAVNPLNPDGNLVISYDIIVDI